MLFNSIEFAVFLPIVFALYWGVFSGSVKIRNAFLIAASYVFYGWWDWRFLILLFFSSFFAYVVGLGLEKYEKPSKRKLLLLISVFVDIGFLAFFKYYNFFSESFAQAFTLFGYKFDFVTLNVVIPLGISFYTFQTLGYSFDVYRKRIAPTRDFLAFFAFIGFFPQLVAGPIERATKILPQFKTERVFDYAKATDGLRQILWGLFKKIVIADNCAYFVYEIYSGRSDGSGSTFFLATFLFAFQIYGDFSGYSDIAIGTGKLFGFDLMKNFNYPFYAKDVPDFWRRWHISLSTWFRDYVYFSLRGRSRWKILRNIFITFALIGLWHGANWTFIIWGIVNAAFFIPFLMTRIYRNKKREKKSTEFSVKKFLKDRVVYFLSIGFLILSLVLFRSENLTQSIMIYSEIFSSSLFTFPDRFSYRIFALITILAVAERIQLNKEHVLKFDDSEINLPTRYLIYFSIVLMILFFAGNTREFIYFQF